MLGLEEERQQAEEKAKRDEEARLDQLSEDEYEALSEEVKAEIDARRLKAKKEKIRLLVHCIHIHAYASDHLYVGGEKSNRNCYNKNKPLKKLKERRKGETSMLHHMTPDHYYTNRSKRKKKPKIPATKTETKVESIKSSRPPSASSIGKQPSLVFRTSALGGLGSTASLDRPLTPSDSPSEPNLTVKPNKYSSNIMTNDNV